MPWHILTTAPKSERMVRNKLHGHGFPAYVPVEMSWLKGKTDEAMARPMMPGYVFAAFYGPTSRDLYRQDIPQWRGIICNSAGTPYALSQRQVDAVTYLSRPASLQLAITSRRVGDRVMTKIGEAQTEILAIVAEIAKGKAVLKVEMFGKLHDVVKTVSDLEKMEKVA